MQQKLLFWYGLEKEILDKETGSFAPLGEIPITLHFNYLNNSSFNAIVE